MTVELHLGNCLNVLTGLSSESLDAVITDPPYSSGGMTGGARSAPPEKKYVNSGTKLNRPTFTGDNRDARSWHFWSTLWISECYRILKPNGYFLMFIDWRQLPTATDALQAGGLIWRGVISWDKGRAARAPHTGYFRHQCEYIVWGTKGGCPRADGRGPFDGSLHYPVLQSDKFHITGKPTPLMKYLVQIVPEGSTILDPFMGSGTTGLACALTRRHFIGVEIESAYYQIAQRRIAEVRFAKWAR